VKERGRKERGEEGKGRREKGREAGRERGMKGRRREWGDRNSPRTWLHGGHCVPLRLPFDTWAGRSVICLLTVRHYTGTNAPIQCKTTTVTRSQALRGVLSPLWGQVPKNVVPECTQGTSRCNPDTPCHPHLTGRTLGSKVTHVGTRIGHTSLPAAAVGDCSAQGRWDSGFEIKLAGSWAPGSPGPAGGQLITRIPL
jgi:hypothetical protein